MNKKEREIIADFKNSLQPQNNHVSDKRFNVDNIGVEEGATCNRDGCPGVIDDMGSECSCYCRTISNPPCAVCTQGSLYCYECGWEEEDTS